MTTPPLKPETPPAGPTVCECGYDLTGLPTDAEAKCPECGVRVRLIRLRAPWWDRFWILSLAYFMPTILIVFHQTLTTAFWDSHSALLASIILFWIALVWYLVLTPLWSVLIVLGRFKSFPIWYQLPIILAVTAFGYMANFYLIDWITSLFIRFLM